MTDSELTLRHTVSPQNVGHVRLEGVLDAHTAPDLDAALEQLRAQGVSRLVCDIERVTYVASAGVGVFIGALNVAQEQGGALVLVCPIEVEARTGETGLTEGFNPMEVFGLLGLSDAFTVARTSAEGEQLLVAAEDQG